MGGGGLLVALSLFALAIVLRGVGSVRLERSEFSFATGMMGVLFAWDFVVEFSVPGILVVTAIFGYLLFRLDRTLRARERGTVPPGAVCAPAA